MYMEDVTNSDKMKTSTKTFIGIGAVALAIILIPLSWRSISWSIKSLRIREKQKKNIEAVQEKIRQQRDSISAGIEGMDSKRIFNLILMDESGSMGHLTQMAIDGANETIKCIQQAEKDHPDQKQYLTLATFDTVQDELDLRYLSTLSPIVDAPEVTDKMYAPNGMTPLHDAMGISISAMEKSLRDDDIVLVTVITDGLENASKSFHGDDIRKMVERLSEKNWTFTYMGANQDAVTEAGKLGISNAIDFKADEEGYRNTIRRDMVSRSRYYGRIGTGAERVRSGYYDDNNR